MSWWLELKAFWELWLLIIIALQLVQYFVYVLFFNNWSLFSMLDTVEYLCLGYWFSIIMALASCIYRNQRRVGRPRHKFMTCCITTFDCMHHTCIVLYVQFWSLTVRGKCLVQVKEYENLKYGIVIFASLHVVTNYWHLLCL